MRTPRRIRPERRRAGPLVAILGNLLARLTHRTRQAAVSDLATTVLLYALALVPLALVSQSRGPQWLTAVGAGLVGYVFGTVLILRLGAPLAQASVYGLGFGLVLAEVAWAISYWSVASLVGGAVLWLVFYVLAGLSQAALEDSLDRRVIIEYAVVTALGLGMVLLARPWE